MTRDEFIDGYLSRSEITELRTPLGFAVDDDNYVALPCACGEEGCEGWAMIGARQVRWHLHQETPAKIENPTARHSDAEGVEMARTYLAEIG